MTDLGKRNNPSGWADLLRLALPLLDHVYATSDVSDELPRWTLGGGTGIALRLGHRVSDDIDIFVGATDLRLFTPGSNPKAALLAASMQFPGNYLKFQLETGEIDFLPGPILSTPGYTSETFDGRRVALQTCEEIILKKVRYRAPAFKPRDIFDLAAVARTSPSLAPALIAETSDRLPALLTAIRRHDAPSFAKAHIKPMHGFEDLLATAVADAARYVEHVIARMHDSRGA